MVKPVSRQSNQRAAQSVPQKTSPNASQTVSPTASIRTDAPTLILFNKPYGVLSQFRNDDNNNFATLSDYFSDKSLRVAGRLDAISEGLLLLTNDGQVNKALTHPPKANAGNKQGKTYWVQVEGQATAAQLQQLRDGVLLKDGKTLPALIEILPDDTAQQLWPAADNIAKRAITSWLAITIFEGKNRQVRRMTAHVGLPCLRLIRMASSGFSLGELAVGEQRCLTLSPADLKRLNVSYPRQTPNHTSSGTSGKPNSPNSHNLSKRKSSTQHKHKHQPNSPKINANKRPSRAR